MKLIKRIVFMACALAAMLLTSCADSSDSNGTGAGGAKHLLQKQQSLRKAGGNSQQQ